MKIALPVNDTLCVYKGNPHTAPKFAIYDIKNSNNHIYYFLSCLVDNPLSIVKCHEFEIDEMTCNCDMDRQKSFSHKCEHYSLLETISECSYLLASKYCENTKESMRKVDIKVFKIPPIINKIDMAIKNFIIGAKLANKIKNIHNAS
ncbi:MAG: putative Fe-Mo cluster-binding NifX family protein [Sulfurimonas sp.]|jgi:predicted Fe-Mo cluster-binding NifX family protein|uniref:NifB/NifX family molybdenum-iron cluster-binding protein n=1 Tax=Sulfurimonas sp. TaxID=2022749 RepID=UPI0039E67A23